MQAGALELSECLLPLHKGLGKRQVSLGGPNILTLSSIGLSALTEPTNFPPPPQDPAAASLPCPETLVGQEDIFGQNLGLMQTTTHEIAPQTA